MLKNITILSLFILIIITLAGCASTGMVVQPSKQYYGFNVSSAYDGKTITIGATTTATKYNGRIFYFQDQSSLNFFLNNPQSFILKFAFNETPEKTSPLTSDYGLKTNCSYNGLPIVVTQFSPTLRYLGRIYYFAHKETLDLFMENPEIFIAKYPANRPAKTISPLKSDYGTKTDCAATGTPLLVGPHTPTLEYLGRVFYFSSLSGMQQFKEDPQAYIAKRFNRE